MNKSSLSRALVAAGVVAFAGIAQAGPMTGSGETNMTPTAFGDGSVQVRGSMRANSGSGETSMTPTTQTLGAGPAYRSRGYNGQAAVGLTGSGETSLTPTTQTMGVPSQTVR